MCPPVSAYQIALHQRRTKGASKHLIHRTSNNKPPEVATSKTPNINTTPTTTHVKVPEEVNDVVLVFLALEYALKVALQRVDALAHQKSCVNTNRNGGANTGKTHSHQPTPHPLIDSPTFTERLLRVRVLERRQLVVDPKPHHADRRQQVPARDRSRELAWVRGWRASA